MIYKNSFLSIFVLIAICLASWTILLFNHTEEAVVAKNSPLPDAFMENVVAFIMNKEGQPKMKIEAPKMFHYTQNDVSNLITPRLTLYRQSPLPWYVTAKFAIANDGIEQVDFIQNVVVEHPADEKDPHTVITTDALTVFPHKDIAQTQQPIKLTQPNLFVTSVGMHANIKTGDIKLLADARGEYVPDK